MDKEKDKELSEMLRGASPQNILISFDDKPAKSLADHVKEQQKKQLPEVLKTQAFFGGVGERQGVYICSPENGGNSFYITNLSDTLADSPKSAHRPTHLEPVQRPVSKAFKRRSHRG